MSHFDNMVELVNDLEKHGGHKNEKLRLFKIILNRPSYLSTLTRTLRNVSEIKNQFKQDPHSTSSYPTVAGEFILNYMTDQYEDSLYSLNHDEKQELIMKIDAILQKL